MSVIVEKELPKGWVMAKMHEMISNEGLFVDGDWVESKDQDENGDVRLTQLADIGDGFWKNRSNRFMTTSKTNELNCTILMKNDILIARMPEPLGRACIFNGDEKPCVTVVDVAIVRTGINGVISKWLMFSINSPQIRSKILSFQSGTTRKRISRKNLSTITFPVPPINEQKRIVAKIEELFSLVDSAKDTLEKTKVLLEQYRQSILKHAFEGKLTSLNEKTSTFNEVVLSDLVIKSQNGLTGRPNDINKGILRLGIETVTGSNSIYIDETKSKFIEVLDSKIKNYIVNFNDLFICRQNGNKNYVGRICVYKGKNPKLIFSDSLIKITIDENQCLSEYIAFFINSKLGRIQLEQYCSTTAGNYSINGTNFKKIMIQLPTLDEQKIIVTKIEESFSLIEKNEILIDKLLLQYNQIKNSILKQAFEGKLVPQDPNDEPAEILLQRIREEKNGK